tara:strand:+ start:308 stop:523 length:216 start_codon:yes stop_codon:yes gene_type:complete
MVHCGFIEICRNMSKSNSILAWFAAIALMALGKEAIAGPDNPGENHEGGDVKDGEGALGRTRKYALFKSHK